MMSFIGTGGRIIKLGNKRVKTRIKIFTNKNSFSQQTRSLVDFELQSIMIEEVSNKN